MQKATGFWPRKSGSVNGVKIINTSAKTSDWAIFGSQLLVRESHSVLINNNNESRTIGTSFLSIVKSSRFSNSDVFTRFPTSASLFLKRKNKSITIIIEEIATQLHIALIVTSFLSFSVRHCTSEQNSKLDHYVE